MDTWNIKRKIKKIKQIKQIKLRIIKYYTNYGFLINKLK